MPIIADNKVTFQGNEPLPAVGSAAYIQAQNNIMPTTAPATAPDTSINSGNVAQNQPMSVTNPAPALGVSGLLGNIASGTTTSIADQQAQAKSDAEKANVDAKLAAENASKQKYVDLLTNNTTKSGITADEYAKTNELGTTVNQTAAAVKKVNNDILAEQNALNEKIATIEKSGGYKEGVNSVIDQAKKDSATVQSNLYIKKLALQGDYESAKAISDRLIDARFEQRQNEIDAAKFDLEQNKELYTTAEQRQYNQAWDKEKRDLDKQKEAEKNVADSKNDIFKAIGEQRSLGVDVPLSVYDAVNNAKTVDEAYKAVGSYGGDLIKKIQYLKAKKDLDALNASPLTITGADYSGFLDSRSPQQITAFNALPDSDKAAVAQLVNGDALLTDIVKSRGANTQAQINKVINQALSVDPTFSINNNKLRYEFQKKWNDPNGKLGVTRNAINTALGHLADFKNSADALDSGTIQKLNSVKNVLSTETGDPNVLRLRSDINALASEVATIYKGSTPTDSEIKSWESTLAANFSKNQFKGVSEELSKLLSSKVTATRYQYKSVMGREFSQSLIDPDKRQELIDAGISPSSLVSEYSADPSANPFGETLSSTSTELYNPQTMQFNIPKPK